MWNRQQRHEPDCRNAVGHADVYPSSLSPVREDAKNDGSDAGDGIDRHDHELGLPGLVSQLLDDGWREEVKGVEGD